ncbi:MAG: bifunctional shikimate kinase/3-dehydroquinate synthase [Bifidobacteriaceae bacterium]|nr:bifunctional shikimate kinase/3-dehydroquinate synthase [Bifidobacteriaceae bacterium]
MKKYNKPLAVLIGMPGAGKSRIGAEAARELNVPFVDTDELIEQEVGMRIPEFFERYGEAEFRRVESDIVIQAIEHEDNAIIALGGGAPMTPSVKRALFGYIRHRGKVVYLKADPQEAMERATRSSNRPMLHGDAQQRWMDLYEQRDPVYHYIANTYVRTQGASPAVAAAKLVDMVSSRIVHVNGVNIKPYDVVIGDNTLNMLPDVLGDKVLRVALIHTNPVQRHSDKARAVLRRANYEVSDIVIPDAEAGKTIRVAEAVWQRLGEEGFTRSDAIVGVGGGAATDVAGFIAATWMRGITYVNCPTSLLAMVDASTGGKTGINTDEGKNLVGSFYTPVGVLADLQALTTLPNDIFIEGLGEVVKSGFIRDTRILDILEKNAEELRNFNNETFNDSPIKSVIAELIERTVRVKAYHVSRDLRESNIREFLNYGHTLGHAIEKIEHFRWRHGNAVAVGSVFAAQLAYELGYVDKEDVDYHRSLLRSVGLPTTWSNGSWQEVLDLMHRDKKARGNSLRFVILDRIGHPIHLDNPPIQAVQSAFESIRGE